MKNNKKDHAGIMNYCLDARGRIFKYFHVFTTLVRVFVFFGMSPRQVSAFWLFFFCFAKNISNYVAADSRARTVHGNDPFFDTYLDLESVDLWRTIFGPPLYITYTINAHHHYPSLREGG